MKAKNKELDIDYIGGQEPLSIVEEEALNEYFRLKKSEKNNDKKKKAKGKTIS